MAEYNKSKEDILIRLRKIEGQIKGIQKMVEAEKDCLDILIQIEAVRSAVNKIGVFMLENHSKKCLIKAASDNQNENTLNELLDVIVKFIK